MISTHFEKHSQFDMMVTVFFHSQRVGTLGAFSMSTAYPKHVFTEDEFSQTLLELNLAPAAAIIILPVNNTRWHFERSSKGRGPGGGCWGREAHLSAH